jgi:uncharacterized membrane protein
MTNALVVALTLLAALGSGLVAGIFFAFSAFVMAALGRLPPDGGIAAMQSINVAVLNTWFFAAFFGTAAACVILAVIALFNWNGPGAIYLLAGSLLYLLGTILVTMAFNVPLNGALAAVEADSAKGAELWTRYLSAWTAWNHVRTAGSLLAAASFILALRS